MGVIEGPASGHRRPEAGGNTDAEKRDIKEGRIPAGWSDKPAKLAQKDRDARWTVKWSKAKPAEDGSPRIDLEVPAFGLPGDQHLAYVAPVHEPRTGWHRACTIAVVHRQELGRGKRVNSASAHLAGRP